MDRLSEIINEELQVKTVFKLFGRIPVSESVVVTWILMAVLILGAFFLTRNLKLHNISKRQAFAEWIVTKLSGLVEGMVGEKGRAFVPYLTTVMLYIGFANICGIFGFKSPTKDLNVTVALALMSIVLVEAAGIYYLGVTCANVKKYDTSYSVTAGLLA